MMKNNKALGQHWLKDREILDTLAEEVSGTEARVCLEIGPGLGTLTSALFRRFEKVIAVEKDERLAENLKKSFPGKDLEVLNEDFLELDLMRAGTPYVVAGNIPYYITSPIILKLVTAENRPEKIMLLMQKEVADRVLEIDGKSSVLSLTVSNYAEVVPGIFVDKSYFTPPPKVNSASVIFRLRREPVVGEEVLEFIKQAFKAPRKKLLKTLPGDREQVRRAFEKLGIPEGARPADLDLNTYKSLYKFMHK